MNKVKTNTTPVQAATLTVASRTDEDFKNAVLVVSLSINAIIFVAWLVIAVA